jgi:predicted metalloendopeptidase
MTRYLRSFFSVAALGFAAATLHAQTATPETHYVPGPAFDTAAIDTKADPCTDFYKFACGNFVAQHPIPGDQTAVDQFYLLYNVNTQELNGILKEYAAKADQHSANEQKIGDYYASCMNTDEIEKKGLAPVQGLLDEISKVSVSGIPYLAGEMQRFGVNVFFGFGEGQDYKDATKQVAQVDQGGLGLPERDYYTRTGAEDVKLREAYVTHITNMLVIAGETPAQAATDAKNILAFETKLAEASQTNTERRDPEVTYHPQTLADFENSIKPVPFKPFLQAIHAPSELPGPVGADSIINGNPKFFPAMVAAVRGADIQTLRAYMRLRLLDTFPHSLPKKVTDESFHFFGTVLNGQPQDRPRWKICSAQVDTYLGEALGEVYVKQYFPASSKDKTLEMVNDIEGAMDKDIDTLEWMSAATKVRAKEKLHGVADKIGYPDHWRDYGKLEIVADDAFGNARRGTEFENDRELNKIGKPVDKGEFGMSPPTVNAYYNPSMNDINFPAGILQPAFYDPKADVAANYGHIGAVIGHELTHGFDDEGKKFDAKGNLADWWTAEDTKQFESKTACLVNEYGNFTAVGEGKDAVKVNGKLTLGENTADNGGLVLAYMAYMARAKKDGIDIQKKTDGYTGPQRFYIAFAQNWCENSRPEAVKQQVLTDPHSPDHFRANGAIVNQPGFGAAFSCKKGAAMAPAESCRVW